MTVITGLALVTIGLNLICLIFFSLHYTLCKVKPLDRPAKAGWRARPPAHLNLLINLRHTFLGVDVEDERPQGLNVAVVDRTSAVLEVCGEELQYRGQSSFYKAAFALWETGVNMRRAVQAAEGSNLRCGARRTLTKLRCSMKVYVIKHPFLNWLSICKSYQTRISPLLKRCKWRNKPASPFLWLPEHLPDA